MSKYNNKKTVIDGIEFDSRAEADYYVKLKMLEAEGTVTHFERQVEFELLPQVPCVKTRDGKRFVYAFGKKNKERSVKYYADFVVHYKDGHCEIVDVKGVLTDVYILKRKMLLHKLSLAGKDWKFVEVRI